MSAPYTELEKPINEYTLLCRGCLASSGEMKNMIEWGLTEDFKKFADVQVDTKDGLSNLLCVTCEETLTACKRFREQCWNSNVILKNTAVKRDTQPYNYTPEDTNTVSCIQYDKKITLLVTAPDVDSKIYLKCPNCNEMYIKKNELYCHVKKEHNMLNVVIDLQYYCHIKECQYSMSSEKNKWFSGRKFLNQHYRKVHSNKINCDTCSQKFTNKMSYYNHLNTCNVQFSCDLCDKSYKKHENLLVHLMRRHPELHKQYKEDRSNKRKSKNELAVKKIKVEYETDFCDSPKRSFATQTHQANIINDVTLWNKDKDDISTQTQTFDDILSLKSQTSEDDSIFFSETVSLSNIHTQTNIDFGLSRSNKETITSGTQSPDLSIKETQTCYCLYDSPRSFKFDSIASSPSNFISAQTQTTVKSDVLFNFNSTQTQTCFDEL